MADIFEKKLLLLGKQKKKYKAYLLYGATVVDVATLGFTEPIDLDTTKGTGFDCFGCNYVILNGKLYYCYNQSSLQRVGNLTNWNDITGYGNANGSSYAYGIAGGKLYRIYGTTTTQVGTATDWTNVSGQYSNSTSIYPYGIAGGKLYYINNTTTTQVGSETAWTFINGFSSTNNYYAYGFNSNKLYKISGTSASTVDSLSWTKISGYSYYRSSSTLTYKTYAYGITDRKLYYIYSGSKGRIGSAINWTDISGFSDYSPSTSKPSCFAIGISGGNLYSIGEADGATTKQISGGYNWTQVSGTVSSSYTAYGINNGNIYRLYWGGTSSKPAVTNSSLSIPNCVKIYGCYYYYPGASELAPALAICEQ